MNKYYRLRINLNDIKNGKIETLGGLQDYLFDMECLDNICEITRYNVKKEIIIDNDEITIISYHNDLHNSVLVRIKIGD